MQGQCNAPSTYVQAADAAVSSLTAKHLVIPNWILQDSSLSVGHRYLYAVLMQYVAMGESTGLGAIPSRETLARQCGCSADTITEWLKLLHSRGWITWERRPNQTNVYSVHGPHSGLGERKSPPPDDSGERDSPEPAPEDVVPAVVEDGNSGADEPETEKPGTDSVSSISTSSQETPTPPLSPQPKRRRKTSAARATEENLDYWSVKPPDCTKTRRELFDFWWAGLPRKIDLERALRAWRQHVGLTCDSKTGRHDFFAASGTWVDHWRRDKRGVQFIPHPATFLNNERWKFDPNTGEEYGHAPGSLSARG